jgi:membrane protein implicated in regulation of membrane protease activity
MKTTSPVVKLFPEVGYGIVEKTITSTQVGRVRFQGSTWKARLYSPDASPLMYGDSVKILGRQGITLLVMPKGRAE